MNGTFRYYLLVACMPLLLGASGVRDQLTLSAAGVTTTTITPGALDRSSGSNETFAFTNAGAGALNGSIDGTFDITGAVTAATGSVIAGISLNTNVIFKNTGTSGLDFRGGNTGNYGGLKVYGQTHATRAGDVEFVYGTTPTFDVDGATALATFAGSIEQNGATTNDFAGDVNLSKASVGTLSATNALTITNSSGDITLDPAADVLVTMPAAGQIDFISSRSKVLLRTDEATSSTSVLGGNQSTNRAYVGGTLYVNTADAGNVGAGEDILRSFTIVPMTLSTDDDYLEVLAWGTFAANGNNKQVQMYVIEGDSVSSILIATMAATALNNGNWRIEATIVRTGTTSGEATTFFSASDASTFINGSRSTDISVADIWESSDLSIVTTGTATSDNDIVQEGMIVRWQKGV